MTRTSIRLLQNLFSSRKIPFIGAILTALLGILVLIGWHVRSTGLIQVFPTLPPMQHNTALCFAMLGMGFVFMLLKQRHASASCSVGVIALAGLTLSQYIGGWNIGIDELWVEGFVTVGTVHPGRMAPISTICSLFAAGALFLAGGRGAKALGASLLTAVGLCAVGASIVFSYSVQLPTTFWWEPASMMALHTATGFAVFGFGLYVHACQQLVRRKLTLFPWSVASLGLALLLVTVGLWQALTVLRQADIQRVVEHEARVALDAVWADLQTRTTFLARMGERWSIRSGIPENEWKEEAGNSLVDSPGLVALQLLNPEYQVRLIVSDEEYNDEQSGKSDLVDDRFRRELEAALPLGTPYTSQLTTLFPGTKGFSTFVPISRNGRLDSVLVGVYRLDEWLNAIFSREGFRNYGVAVVHKGQLVYQRAYDLAPNPTSWIAERELTLNGLDLRIQIWPERQLRAALHSPLPEIVLVFGLLMSALLTWTFSMARSIRKQGLALKEANRILLEKNRRLLCTEESLKMTTQLQRAILEGASYPIISTDAQGVIRSFNRAASLALGYQPDEVLGRHTVEIFHDPQELVSRARQMSKELGVDVQPGVDSCVSKVRCNEAPDESEWTLIRKDGSRFSAKVSITGLQDESGAIAGYVGIVNDLTGAKVAEDTIRAARDLAEQANQAKSRFLANMSHEVRTPLNGILGINQMLLESGLQPEQRLWVRTLQDSAESLLTIVNDILDFSKVEAGQVEIESIEFDLGETLDQLRRLHGPKASTKGLVLQTRTCDSIPRKLVGDPTRLLQVLNNLVSNAIKFTERGTIFASVAASDEQSGADSVLLRFEVVDRGIGMSEEARRRIFDPFAQADASTTRRFGGTGLGLSICRQLVHKMGGEIDVESTSGEGSKFWFTATFQIPESRKSAAPPMPAESDANKGGISWGDVRVLLADDSATNRLVARHQLQKLGCKVEVAENGSEALQVLSRRDFDVVLMDGQMPEMDGYEATIELRRREGSGRRTPVVALTANALPGERERCLAVGMDHYLSKPFKADQLEMALREVLTGARLVS